MKKTTEFSFILKPSKYGVGVFATHNIAKGTYLRLFNEKDIFRSICCVYKIKKNT